MAAVASGPVVVAQAGGGANAQTVPHDHAQTQAPGSPKSLSGDHQRSLCSNGPAGSGQRKKRRHPIARVKGNWLPDEDERLRALVKSEGEGQWSVIAKAFPGRIGKQCRERWHNQLRPDIKREAWTDDEEIILIGCHLRLGNKWADIAKELVGRTENAGGATKLKEYMRSLNILPHKRKRKLADGVPRSPRSPRSPGGNLPGMRAEPCGRKRNASAGETPCSHKQPALFMEQLMRVDSPVDDALPLYDHTFSAASCRAPPKGTPTQVLMPTASSTGRHLQPMMPAQGSTISDTTHFTGGQVLLPSGPLGSLGCPEHLGDLDIMHDVSPPPKRPPLPRLDIPGAPCSHHVPACTTHNAALTPRGRIDGLGWVNHEEDENLENALNALNYHDANPGLLNTRDPANASPALFSGIGASLGISPFQAALLNFTPGNHHTPRSGGGWSMRTPQGFMGPPAALVVPPQWALQDMSSASVRPPRTSSVVDPAACPGTCPMGPVLSPYNADADAVVKDFIASPVPLMPSLMPGEFLLFSDCPEAMGPPEQPLQPILPASSRNVNIYVEAAAVIAFALDAPELLGGQAPHMCEGGPARLAPVWEGEQVAESPYQKFMQDFVSDGVPPDQAIVTRATRAEKLERTSSDNSASAPVPADIQNMIRSMWSCEAEPQEGPTEAPQGASPREGSSMIAALGPPAASAKAGKRSRTGAMKAVIATRSPRPASATMKRQLRSRQRLPRATI